MAQILACLRGWNVPLAQAEVAALLPSTDFTALAPRFMLTSDTIGAETLAETLSCAAGIQCFLLDVKYFNTNEDTSDKFYEKIITMLSSAAVRGSVAVRTLRISGRIDGVSTRTMAAEIGAIAVDQGNSVDLAQPDYEIGLIADGESQIIACGWLVGDFDDSVGTAPRRATERPFFKPVSLDPRLARLSVNLACGPLDDYAVLDPMTGTGGFAMEAVTMGRNTVAVDMDEVMVAGAKQNIDWALQNHDHHVQYQIIQGDASNLQQSVDEIWHGKISGIVLDPPYGRNSHGTLEHFQLITATIQSAKSIVATHAKLVLIMPIKPAEHEIVLLHGIWQDFTTLMRNSGVEIIQYWSEHVHASLARLIILAEFTNEVQH
tara:strand:+ start:4493 stop:5620 length:1128 start_codon:yes stop_codon:yes gene_type:complete